MGFITNLTKKTMRDALIGHSRKLGVLPSEVRIVIKTDNENELPKYQVHAKKVDFKQEVQFKDLIFEKVDFYDKHVIAPPFIQDALKRIANDSKLVGAECKATDLMVIISTQETKHEYEPNMYLFKNNEQIQQITFDYFIEGNL